MYQDAEREKVAIPTRFTAGEFLIKIHFFFPFFLIIEKYKLR